MLVFNAEGDAGIVKHCPLKRVGLATETVSGGLRQPFVMRELNADWHF